jgi:hypothetical protein
MCKELQLRNIEVFGDFVRFGVGKNWILRVWRKIVTSVTVPKKRDDSILGQGLDTGL